jgi:hypothetical protein
VIAHLLQALGITDSSGAWYAFWSGFGSDITMFVGFGAVAWSFYRRHNCHVKGCWRVGRHAVDGTSHVVCKHHHPEGEPSHEDVIRAHRRR